MTKKFNLKSGNCPSFKEMGGDSPFNQGFGNFLRKAGNTMPGVMAFNAMTGNKDAPNFFKDMIEKFQEEKDAESVKLSEKTKKITSQLGEASEIPGGHGGSRSTRRFKETNEKLPEQDKV